MNAVLPAAPYGDLFSVAVSLSMLVPETWRLLPLNKPPPLFFERAACRKSLRLSYVPNPFALPTGSGFGSASLDDGGFSCASPGGDVFGSASPGGDVFSSASPGGNVFGSASPGGGGGFGSAPPGADEPKIPPVRMPRLDGCPNCAALPTGRAGVGVAHGAA